MAGTEQRPMVKISMGNFTGYLLVHKLIFVFIQL